MKEKEMRIRFLGWEDPLEESKATHSSILAWKIPWTEEPGGLRSTGHKESDTSDLARRVEGVVGDGRSWLKGTRIFLGW